MKKAYKRFGSIGLAVVVSGLLLVSGVSCGQHSPEGDVRNAGSNAQTLAQTDSERTPETTPAAPEPAQPAASAADTAENQEGQVQAGEQLVSEKEDASTEKANILLAQAVMDDKPKTTRTAADSRWKRGKHYQVVNPAGPVTVPPGKIEVVEVFWYGCPHCYGLEPYLQHWETKKADYIEFIRVPATWGEPHQLHARLFFTLKNLNRMDLHMTAFREFQLANNLLLGRTVAETEKVQLDFAKRHGIKEADFKREWHSDTVNEQIRKASELLLRYKIDTVPHMIIQGKYLADITSAGGHSQLLALIDDLAAREHDKK